MPPPATAQVALAGPVAAPVRVTWKVKSVAPAWPSERVAARRAMDSVPEGGMSSLKTTAVAVAVPMVTPAGGLERVTVKLSFSSRAVSPAT
jgi:hypothetical protein